MAINKAQQFAAGGRRTPDAGRPLRGSFVATPRSPLCFGVMCNKKGDSVTECIWERVGLLDESDCEFSELRTKIGVYKAEHLGDLVYIGKATEHSNGGLRKRLRDYTRLSDSARNYPSGQKMHKHQGELII